MTELYFLTWDEVEERQEVWVFDGSDDKRCWPSSRVTKKGESILLDGERDDIANTTNFRKFKFLPVPQDRPKPQIWDEWVDIGKNGFNGFKFIGFVGTSENIHYHDLVDNPDQAKALLAYINHVLGENNG